MNANREAKAMQRNSSLVALIAAVGFTATSCSHDLTGLNTNPNSPTSAPATSLFTNAAISAVQRFNGAGTADDDR